MKEKGEKINTNINDESVEFLIKDVEEQAEVPEIGVEEYEVKTKKVKGSKTAQHSLKIEYCGSWGFGKKVDALVHEIEDELDGMFRFYIYRDKGDTGRFEVTLYRDESEDTKPEKAVLMFSKKMTGKLLEQRDFGKFIDDLKEVAGIEEWSQNTISSQFRWV